MRVGFDINGTHDVKFADFRKIAVIYNLGQAFLTKEDTLDDDERTVYTEDIRALLASMSEALDLKSTGSSQRTLSSEEIKALDKQATTLIKKVHALMMLEFGDTPAEATRWGFDVKQTGKRRGTILMPDGRAAIVKTLGQYAKTEKARPAAERFKSPLLAEVQAVVDGLNTNVNTRTTAKGQRASGVQQSNEASAHLLDLLQAAAVQIVVKQFECKVTPDLAQWGFEVTAKVAPRKKTPSPTSKTA